MRLPGNYLAPRYKFADFCDGEPSKPLTEKEILRRVAEAAARRWPDQETSCSRETKRLYDDPFTDVDPAFMVVIVCRNLRVVARAADPSREIGLDDLPQIEWKPKIGDKWYENIAFVLVGPAAIAPAPQATGHSSGPAVSVGQGSGGEWIARLLASLHGTR